MNAKFPLLLAASVLGLQACATAPEQPSAPAQPVNLTKVYFYPMQGQSPERQDRDRYECYLWAVDQTGFDPARRIGASATRATVVPARSSGQTVGTGTAVGAALGAVAAGPGDALEGAVIGAIAGAVVGSAVASAQESEARAVQSRYNQRGQGRHEREAAEYRRAMSACLEGRGYSVR
jgi:hypothetical protein